MSFAVVGDLGVSLKRQAGSAAWDLLSGDVHVIHAVAFAVFRIPNSGKIRN